MDCTSRAVIDYTPYLKFTQRYIIIIIIISINSHGTGHNSSLVYLECIEQLVDSIVWAVNVYRQEGEMGFSFMFYFVLFVFSKLLKYRISGRSSKC